MPAKRSAARRLVTVESPFAVENQAMTAGYRTVAGVDEAGRGPLAGPVVAAAVILPADFDPAGIGDSKAMKEHERVAQFERIMKYASAVGTGLASHEEIDGINILRASLEAMRRAVEQLSMTPDFLVVDGKFKVPMDIHQRPLVHGDALCVSVAAASIVAKVTRDRIMEELDRLYPVYGFARHKGYPTKSHYDAIRTHGPCPVHRKSFKGVIQPQS